MAAAWLATYRVVLLATVVVGFFLLYQTRKHRGKPGSRPLALLVFGGLLYVSVKLAVSALRGTSAVFAVTRFNPLAAGLATAGFFLLVVEYTGIENRVSRRTVAALLVEPVAVSLLVFTDIEYLWTPVGPDPGSLSGYAWEISSIAIANQLYMNVVLLVGIGLLVRFSVQSATVFRTQVAALLFAAAVPIAGNLAFYAGAVPFNPTPVAFVFSGLVIAWAILGTGFLDLVPVGRSAVVDELGAGVVTVDRDHRVIDTNASGQRMFGLADAVAGSHVDEAFANRPSFRERYWSITDGETEPDSPVECDGRYFAVEMLSLGDDETLRGRTMVANDVTEQRLRERELERKNEQLERFASVIAHDIRNPLNVVQSRVELARHDDADTQLDSIAENAARIEAIIEDALALTRDGGLRESRAINVGTVARRAWGHVETDETTLETDCYFSLEGDPGRLVQLFENVFHNALEHGGDVTTVRVGALLDETGSVRGFFISDDGVGIPEESRETVTEDGYTTSEKGTGLGLSIVSEIVETHGWQMTVSESETGGARFEIERPEEALGADQQE